AGRTGRRRRGSRSRAKCFRWSSPESLQAVGVGVVGVAVRAVAVIAGGGGGVVRGPADLGQPAFGVLAVARVGLVGEVGAYGLHERVQVDALKRLCELACRVAFGAAPPVELPELFELGRVLAALPPCGLALRRGGLGRFGDAGDERQLRSARAGFRLRLWGWLGRIRVCVCVCVARDLAALRRVLTKRSR